jgi:hypothetical protein
MHQGTHYPYLLFTSFLRKKVEIATRAEPSRSIETCSGTAKGVKLLVFIKD